MIIGKDNCAKVNVDERYTIVYKYERKNAQSSLIDNTVKQIFHRSLIFYNASILKIASKFAINIGFMAENLLYIK